MAKSKLRRNEKALSAVRPSAAVAAAYQKRIDALVVRMQNSYLYWTRCSYRANSPKMAMDAPANKLETAIERMARYWQTKFDKAADDMAGHFAKSAKRRSEAGLKTILAEAGWTVNFVVTPLVRDVMAATVKQSVALIKSIPKQYHLQVQGAVMRSVQSGRDLASLTRELRSQFGVTRRRAAFIALDQNNKATSAILSARQTDLGIEEGIWMHSHAGRKPRVTHLANDGKRFNIREGWYDPDPKVRRRIKPGELPRCRCTWKPIVKGFS